MDFVFNLSYLLIDWSLPLDHTCLADLYFDTPLPENQQRDPTCRIITLNLFSLVQLHSPLPFYVPLSSADIGSQQRGKLLLSPYMMRLSFYSKRPLIYDTVLLFRF